MKRLFSLFTALLALTVLQAQNTTVLSIGDKKFSEEEFNYIYSKNNALTQEPVSKQQYLDLFVNYKLKVEEAISQGYDTVPSFKKELEYYRNELAKPYLNDKKATDEVVKEAYEHMLYELEASHILIKLPQSPSPEDTLRVYQTMAEIKRQLDAGVDFKLMVAKHSECPSAQQSNGNLGYFGAFMMVYPFEKAAYDTPVGQVSDITRTSFGYHLIKVHDKRKNKGEVLVAHIMKAFPYQSGANVQKQAKEAIDSIYQKIQNGESFEDLVAEYSDDKQTVPNKGQLPWFGTGRMVKEFSDAAFVLKEDGQVSAPVRTKFGWHIIKRLDARPVKPIEECEAEIMQKIKRDERAFAGKKATLERLKKEYNYKPNKADLKKLEKLMLTTSTADKNEFLAEIREAELMLASFDQKQILASDFAAKAFRFNLPPAGFSANDFSNIWNGFVDNELLDYEKRQLEAKYPDFKFLMNEYHDGLLIFEISQKEVWNKASNDSIGLAEFYERNKNNYVLDEHFEGKAIFCNSKSAHKKLKKLLKKNPDLQLDSLDAELTADISIKEGPFFKGENVMLDRELWKVKPSEKNFEYVAVLPIGEIKQSRIQELDEIRGRVISDYQEELEKNWIQDLKQKFKPEVNTFVFK